ncbi:MAG: CvpA family protein [Phycisphaerae bacterium]
MFTTESRRPSDTSTSVFDGRGETNGEYGLAPVEPSSRRVPVIAANVLPGPVAEAPRLAPAFPALAFGLVCGAALGGLALSAEDDFLLGQGAAVVIGLAVLHGLWRGGLRKLVLFPVTVTAAYIGARHAGDAEPVVRILLGRSSLIGNYVAMAAAIAATLWAVRALVERFRRRYILPRSGRVALDRWAGGVIGLLQGSLVVLAFCWLISAVNPNIRTLAGTPPAPTGATGSQLVRIARQLTDEATRGVVGRMAAATNPLKYFPDVRSALGAMGQTGRIRLDDLDLDVSRLPLSVQDMIRGLTASGPNDGATGVDPRLLPGRRSRRAVPGRFPR